MTARVLYSFLQRFFHRFFVYFSDNFKLSSTKTSLAIDQLLQRLFNQFMVFQLLLKNSKFHQQNNEATKLPSVLNQCFVNHRACAQILGECVPKKLAQCDYDSEKYVLLRCARQTPFTFLRGWSHFANFSLEIGT